MCSFRIFRLLGMRHFFRSLQRAFPHQRLASTFLGPQGSSIGFPNDSTIVVTRACAPASSQTPGGWPARVQVISDSDRVGSVVLSLASQLKGDVQGLTTKLASPCGVSGIVVAIDGEPFSVPPTAARSDFLDQLNRAQSFTVLHTSDTRLITAECDGALSTLKLPTATLPVAPVKRDTGGLLTTKRVNAGECPLIGQVKYLGPDASAADSNAPPRHIKFSFVLHDTPGTRKALMRPTHSGHLYLVNLQADDVLRLKEATKVAPRCIRILRCAANNADDLFKGRRRRTLVGVTMRRQPHHAAPLPSSNMDSSIAEGTDHTIHSTCTN
jgi:hypothetical protein